MTRQRTEQWNLRTLAGAVLCAGVLVAFYRIIGCPIRFVTGISCAGCGMTRAWLSVLRLDFRQAFYYHPLFPLPPVALAMLLARRRIPQRVFKGCIYAMAVLFLIVYVYRLCMGDGTVVTAAPREGLVFRVVSYLRGGN